MAADIRAARERQFSRYSSLSSVIFEPRPSLGVTDTAVLPSRCSPASINVRPNDVPSRTIPRETREISVSFHGERARDSRRETNRWAVVSSSFFSDLLHRGGQLSREAPDRSLRRLPSVARHYLPLHDPRSVFPSMDLAGRNVIASSWHTGGRCHERTRHYKHRTIERNGRSDCFVLSSASLAGKSGRRVTWTSTVTTRSGLAGSTSSRLSAIYTLRFLM